MATHDHAHVTHGTHATHDVHAHAHVSDQRPAFLGLIIGGIALGAILYGTVAWTNTRFAGHGEAPAAGAQHAAPAAH
jgi:hypothetical protein